MCLTAVLITGCTAKETERTEEPKAAKEVAEETEKITSETESETGETWETTGETEEVTGETEQTTETKLETPEETNKSPLLTNEQLESVRAYYNSQQTYKFRIDVAAPMGDDINGMYLQAYTVAFDKETNNLQLTIEDGVNDTEQIIEKEVTSQDVSNVIIKLFETGSLIPYTEDLYYELTLNLEPEVNEIELLATFCNYIATGSDTNTEDWLIYSSMSKASQSDNEFISSIEQFINRLEYIEE